MPIQPADRRESILWRRLDVPGHDAATLVEDEAGAELRGMAVFRDPAGPTALRYRVCCDAGWRTTEAQVRGWRGVEPVALRLGRDESGRWTVNGAPSAAADDCVDVDLGFTPATNLLPLRRLSLRVGQAAEVRSAWLESPSGALTTLVQRYERQSPEAYRYEADLPGGETFRGTLRTDARGWVLDYSGLWRAER